MKRSSERFLCTHTGSLPRPERLIRDMYAKEEGVPVDGKALAEHIRAAVAEVVTRQIEAGVDIVNDGEMSKPSYATYIKDRLAGFGGESIPVTTYQDLKDFPGLQRKVFGDPGRSRRKTPACNAAVAPRDVAAAKTDAANLTAALSGKTYTEGFMSAASPGVVSLFFHNGFYKTREAYLEAIAEAMRPEYETIAAAGLVVQLDCPDLAMGRHIQFGDLDLKEFRKQAAIHIAALNHATRNIPADRLRLHLCWGNYEGPHHCDVAIADVIDLVFAARPEAISFEAANPRHAHEWKIFETVKLPAGKLLIPGVLESKSNFIEHPELVAQRLGRYADLVGRENVVAGSDCGYGTWVGQAAVDPQVVWAKMAAMAEGCRIATRRFWP
jgi:5-methyltetrahydropteroyltriglutamate--homocysteine methyltransferase